MIGKCDFGRPITLTLLCGNSTTARRAYTIPTGHVVVKIFRTNPCDSFVIPRFVDISITGIPSIICGSISPVRSRSQRFNVHALGNLSVSSLNLNRRAPVIAFKAHVYPVSCLRCFHCPGIEGVDRFPCQSRRPLYDQRKVRLEKSANWRIQFWQRRWYLTRTNKAS